MSRVKTSLDHKRIRRLIWLVLTVFVLLGYSLQSVAGSAYYSMVMEAYGTVSSPPVFLEEGNCSGTSTIYANKTSAKVNVEPPLFDYVDNNDPDVDSSADKGTHSNFPAQQAGPDSTYDTLTEENTEGIEDYVDNISDVDNSTDIGTHSNFENEKLKDGNYDTLTEFATGEISRGGASQGQDTSATVTFSHTLGYSSGNNRLVIVAAGFENSAGDINIGSATYNGQSMTKIVQATTGGAGYAASVALFYLLDSSLPSSSGSYSVVVTADSNPSADLWACAVSYIGVKQEAPDDYDSDYYVGSTTMTSNLDCDENGSMLVQASVVGATGSFTPSSGTTEVIEDSNINSASAVFNEKLNQDAGARDLGCTQGSMNRGAWVGACWAPVSATEDYGLDLEVQFTSVIDFLSTEKLCIYTGALGSEDLRVDYWNGTGWENLATDLNAYSCNAYTVSLTSTTFTVRFRDGTTAGDTNQDQWQIDASLLRVEGAGDKEDAVDQQSNVDGPTDIGTHSNFSAQQYGPDSINDTLTEQNTAGTGGNWGITSSAFGSTSVHSNYRYMGGTSPDVDNMKVTKLHIRYSGTGTVAIALYTGGTLADPTGATKRTEAYNVAVSTGWNEIDVPDYDWGKNTVTWVGWCHGGGSVYYSTSSGDSGDFQSARGRWSQTNPADADETSSMPNSPGSGGFGNFWYAVYIEYETPPNYEMDLEIQWTGIPYLLPNEELCIYGGIMGAEDIKVDVRNGSSWVNIISDMNASAWNNVTITSFLTSSTFTIRFKGGNETGDPGQDTWQIDVALIHIWHEGGETYQLDLEVQWTNADYDETNEELAIYVDKGNTHSLDATGGYMIIGDGTPDWGSTTGTISFWIKWDTVANRSWGQHDNMETRFSGGTNLILDWGAVGSITSSTSFTADKWYFIAIVWNENTDDLYLYVGDRDNAPTQDTYNNNWTTPVSTVGVTQNNFMASKSGVEPMDGHGDELRYWNTGRTLTEIQNDYNTELTGSEINLRSYFKLNNNFDDIGPNNNDGSGSGSYSFSTDVPFPENIRVDVWNATAWQNLFTDLTNGWNNVSVSSYLTSSNFTIRFKGSNETSDTTQDSWNIDATLLHVWTSEGTYNYVLKVVNQVTYAWNVSLKVYDSSNIERLSSLNISLHDGTSSNQIAVSGGSIVKSEGEPYDLPEGQGSTIYIAISNLAATTNDTSYLYVHLKIQVPNTSTYILYVITFEIT